MSEQRKAAVTPNTTNSSYSSSYDFYSKSLEQRLSDAERKNSQFQRDKLLRDSQESFNRIDSEAKKTYDDRMKWKPGDK